MAKAGKNKTDIVTWYFPEDDGVFLIISNRDATISLEDLPGVDLDATIKHLKKRSAKMIQLKGITATVSLSEPLRKELLKNLEYLKKERDYENI